MRQIEARSKESYDLKDAAERVSEREKVGLRGEIRVDIHIYVGFDSTNASVRVGATSHYQRCTTHHHLLGHIVEDVAGEYKKNDTCLLVS